MKNFFFLILSVTLLVVLNNALVNAQTVKIGGYMQSWFLNQQNNGYASHPGVESDVTGFRVRRARLNVKTDLNDVFSIDSWFDFADAQKALLDFKGIAKIAPEFIVTIGQFTPPVSMYETSSLPSSKIPFYELTDISIKLAGNMGLDAYRDVGMMVGGTFMENFKYGVFYGNGTGRFNYANTTIINRKFGQGLIGFRLDAEPVKNMFLGMHYSVNKQDSVNTGTTAAPVFSNKDRSSYSFNAGSDGFGMPGLYTQFEYGNGKINDIVNSATTDYNGWYATAGYKVLPVLQLLARYDSYSETAKSTKNLADVTKKANNVTVGATYFFMKEKTELVKVGINYESRKEDPVESKNNTFVIWTQFKF